MSQTLNEAMIGSLTAGKERPGVMAAEFSVVFDYLFCSFQQTIKKDKGLFLFDEQKASQLLK